LLGGGSDIQLALHLFLVQEGETLVISLVDCAHDSVFSDAGEDAFDLDRALEDLLGLVGGGVLQGDRLLVHHR